LSAPAGPQQTAVFNVEPRNDTVPRYCTDTELADALRQRYDAICPAGSECEPKEAFVAKWQKNTETVGFFSFLNAEYEKAWNVRKGTECLQDERCTDQLTAGLSDQRKWTARLSRKNIVWLLDPNTNRAELTILRALGFDVQCPMSDSEAVKLLKGATGDKSVVVVNFGKTDTGSRAFDLLDKVKNHAPVIIYSTNVTHEHMTNARLKGAFGETDDPFALKDLVLDAAMFCAPNFVKKCVAEQPFRRAAQQSAQPTRRVPQE
jgi:hypothetical protein